MTTAAPEGAARLTASPAPLAGFTVGVTAAHRAEELSVLLRRRGAEVLHGPALRIAPLDDDRRLELATRELVARPADVTVVTSGVGLRGWIEACETWGLGEQLVAALRSSRLLARGSKATGALRAAGLPEAWSPPSESSDEVLQHLLARGVAGSRIAVQLHNGTLPEFRAALRAAGADVVAVPVYRCGAPLDTGPLDRLIDAAVGGEVDAVTFTSAPAAAGVLDRADGTGRGADLERALRGPVLAVSVGRVTAGPLTSRGLPTVWPERGRIGAQVRLLSEELAGRATTLTAAGRTLQLRGSAVVLDGEVIPLHPGPVRLLRELARQPGRVRGREELLSALGSRSGPHAVDTAVMRLRSALGDARLVQTVVKRGYRLAVDHTARTGEEEW
ncbi:uroporphyrinogen-III synthase [Haloactinospora alba]|uniref:Uroporphyrinogen-III synthase n=1 Tax=Haloactinospora alba TaxID=405555 RepID=A0A543NNJ5_9ACTN|nr:uroporphyrinogen-III synthase [Haloactinospora alba]TQN33408.1 uroporphyrinogen-III synthase [Haloactinospora alba]